MRIVQGPAEDPDTIARRAGFDMYGSSVGHLRRRELARLANAFGIRFHAGATKDEMLETFRRMEMQGVHLAAHFAKAPLVPQYADEQPPAAPALEPPGVSPFDDALKARIREKLEALPVGTLRKLVAEQAIPQRATDKKPDLIDKLLNFAKSDIVV